MSVTDTCVIHVPGRRKAITQGMVLIQLDKALVVLSRRQFVDALKAGKRWKRRQAFQARLAAVTDRTKEEESSGQQRESR